MDLLHHNMSKMSARVDAFEGFRMTGKLSNMTQSLLVFQKTFEIDGNVALCSIEYTTNCKLVLLYVFKTIWSVHELPFSPLLQV